MIFTEPTVNKFRILIVITNPKNILHEQFDFIDNYSSISCMTIEYVVMNNLTDLTNTLNSCFITYNFLYFIGHGDIDGLVIGNDTEPFYWSDIIPIINSSDCISKDCLFFIHSCYSYKSSTYILENCTKIKSLVCFKNQSNNIYGYTSFFMFVFYIVFKEKTYKEAVEIIKETAYEDLHCLEK